MKLQVLAAAALAATAFVASAGEYRNDYSRGDMGMGSGNTQTITITGNGDGGVTVRPISSFILPISPFILSNPRQACRYPSNLYRAGDHCLVPGEPEAPKTAPVKVEEPHPPVVEPLIPVAPVKPENG